MTARRDKAAGRPTPLRRMLYRAYLAIVTIAVVLAGASMLLGGLVTLRFYAEGNLHHIARSIGYTAEAALVFKDPVAAEETLGMIARAEHLARADIIDRDGHVVASWTRNSGGPFAVLERHVARLVLSMPVSASIKHDNVPIGEVRVWDGGAVLLRFLLAETIGALACLALSMVIALRLSRRMLDSIVGPLQSLARVAHVVRRQRDFTQRVPSASIAELNDLRDDFNALLDELEAWHAIICDENARLMHEATHDTLTGLPNRAFFESRLRRAVAEAQLSRTTLAVMFLDSDRFKEINDNFGHAAGDAVLTCIARRLRETLRASDLVARLGGDEFAILLAPLHHPDDAMHIADIIIANQRSPIALAGGVQVVAPLSIGISLYPGHAQDAQSLLSAADAAMYEVKRQRQGGWKLASSPRIGQTIPELDT